jgi:hypothetical protein
MKPKIIRRSLVQSRSMFKAARLKTAVLEKRVESKIANRQFWTQRDSFFVCSPPQRNLYGLRTRIRFKRIPAPRE